MTAPTGGAAPSTPARVGITGHIGLSADTMPLVEAALRELLGCLDPRHLVGISCLAPGADTIFAELVLELGGRLEAIVPAVDYRAAQLVDAEARSRFDGLVARADVVVELPIETSGAAAYAAANRELLARSDRLIAVWDGVATDRPGSTGSVVARATCPVVRVWPAGAERA